MPYWVRVFNHGQMTDIDLSDKKFFSVGSAERDDYQIIHDGIKPHHIVFQFKGNVWHIKCQENVTIGKAPVTEKTVNVGDAYVLKATHNIAFVIYSDENTKTKRINISELDVLTIGRNAENTIQFLNNRISGTHAKIYKKNDNLVVEDINSTNGTFVNNEKIKKAILENNDVISIGIYDVIYNNGELVINNAINDLNIHIVEEEDTTDEAYPYFKRSPRLKLEIPTGEIEIQAPPTIGSKPEINWLTVLVPPLSMIGIMVGVMFLTKGSTMSLLYTAPMSLITYESCS